MASPYSFSVSLRIRHPKMDLAPVGKALRIKPRNAWRSGERRKTPTGTPLSGINRESFWTARLIDKRLASPARATLGPSLAKVVQRLQNHRALFRRIQRGGGRLELFIGVFGQGRNFGDEVSAKVLLDLGKLGLSLSLDIYS